MNCEICYTDLLSVGVKYKSAKYCSNKCKQKAWRIRHSVDPHEAIILGLQMEIMKLRAKIVRIVEVVSAALPELEG